MRADEGGIYCTGQVTGMTVRTRCWRRRVEHIIKRKAKKCLKLYEKQSLAPVRISGPRMRKRGIRHYGSYLRPPLIPAFQISSP